MSRFGHRSSGSSQRAAGDALSRAQRTAIPKRQDTSSGARFRGLPFPCPEHLPSCPEPLRFRGKATLLNAEVFPRGRNARTRSPLSPQRSPFPGSAASFRLGTLLVHALASAHPSDAEILPTDVCHPIYFSLPTCTRAPSLERFPGSRPALFRETRRFTPTNLLWRDRSFLPVGYSPIGR